MFDFKQSDFTNGEFRVPIKILLEEEVVYSHHKYDFGRTKQQCDINL